MWLEAEGGQEGGFLDPLGRKIGTNQLPGRQVANCMWRGWGNVQGTGTGRITPVWTLFAPPGQWVDGHVPSWGGGPWSLCWVEEENVWVVLSPSSSGRSALASCPSPAFLPLLSSLHPSQLPAPPPFSFPSPSHSPPPSLHRLPSNDSN